MKLNKKSLGLAGLQTLTMLVPAIAQVSSASAETLTDAERISKIEEIKGVNYDNNDAQTNYREALRSELKAYEEELATYHQNVKDVNARNEKKLRDYENEYARIARENDHTVLEYMSHKQDVENHYEAMLRKFKSEADLVNKTNDTAIASYNQKLADVRASNTHKTVEYEKALAKYKVDVEAHKSQVKQYEVAKAEADKARKRNEDIDKENALAESKYQEEVKKAEKEYQDAKTKVDAENKKIDEENATGGADYQAKLKDYEKKLAEWKQKKADYEKAPAPGKETGSGKDLSEYGKSIFNNDKVEVFDKGTGTNGPKYLSSRYTIVSKDPKAVTLNGGINISESELPKGPIPAGQSIIFHNVATTNTGKKLHIKVEATDTELGFFSTPPGTKMNGQVAFGRLINAKWTWLDENEKPVNVLFPLVMGDIDNSQYFELGGAKIHKVIVGDKVGIVSEKADHAEVNATTNEDVTGVNNAPQGVAMFLMEGSSFTASLWEQKEHKSSSLIYFFGDASQDVVTQKVKEPFNEPEPVKPTKGAAKEHVAEPIKRIVVKPVPKAKLPVVDPEKPGTEPTPPTEPVLENEPEKPVLLKPNTVVPEKELVKMYALKDLPEPPVLEALPKKPVFTPKAVKPAETPLPDYNCHTDYTVEDKSLETIQTPKVETPKVETPKVETPKVETPKVETPKVETPKVETPKVETPKVETPVETPKVDTPKVETPKVETPKVETPKVETPKVETPKVETPKAETPVSETPKVEIPKLEGVVAHKATKVDTSDVASSGSDKVNSGLDVGKIGEAVALPAKETVVAPKEAIDNDAVHKPVDLTDAEPVKPTEPTKPTEPVKPTEPAAPTAPEEHKSMTIEEMRAAVLEQLKAAIAEHNAKLGAKIDDGTKMHLKDIETKGSELINSAPADKLEEAKAKILNDLHQIDQTTKSVNEPALVEKPVDSKVYNKQDDKVSTNVNTKQDANATVKPDVKSENNSDNQTSSGKKSLPETGDVSLLAYSVGSLLAASRLRKKKK